MAKISKIGHVVLGCRDPQASIKFYTEILGMELVQFNQELQMAFFSFGERDHDIAVIKVPEDQPVGSAGLTHTALQIEGGGSRAARTLSAAQGPRGQGGLDGGPFRHQKRLCLRSRWQPSGAILCVHGDGGGQTLSPDHP